MRHCGFTWTEALDARADPILDEEGQAPLQDRLQNHGGIQHPLGGGADLRDVARAAVRDHDFDGPRIQWMVRNPASVFGTDQVADLK